MLNPEDDIENIYRDFAKNYPLKTDDSGWDEFLQKMERAPATGMPASRPGAGGRFIGIVKKHSYWLTAAALVAIITGVLFFKTKNDDGGPATPINNTTTASAVKHSPSPATVGKNVQTVNESRQDQTPAGTLQQLAPKPGQLSVDSVTDNSALLNKQSTPLTHEKTSEEPASDKKQNLLPNGVKVTSTELIQANTKGQNGSQQNVKQKEAKTNQIKNTDKATHNTIVTNDKGFNRISNAGNSINGKLINGKSITADGKPQIAVRQETNADKLNQADNKGSILGDSETRGKTVQASAGAKIVGYSGQSPVSTDSMQNALAQNNPLSKQNQVQNTAGSAKKQTDKVMAVQPMVKIKTSDKKYFYVGFVTGPDFSTVKFQKVKSTGYTAGLMLGVHLANNVSIESGLLYTAKKYYSSGTYFKINGLPPPDRDDLQSVNATGKFFEVPITVKYNFVNKRSYDIFLNGGFSSYFTSNEKYDLLFRRPFGSEVRRDDDDGMCANILSVIHLSAGYEFKLNGSNTLRLEPYIKIPLSGLGSGSLPVTSGGLYINFTHSFLK